METRIDKLEQITQSTGEGLAALGQDVVVVKSNYATKADLAPMALDVAVIKSNYATKADMDEVKRDVAVIKSNYSTKADLANVKSSIIMWTVSAIFLAQLLPGLLRRLGWE